MLRVAQFLVSSPLHKWKPLETNVLSFILTSSTRSSSSSSSSLSRESILLPLVSTRRNPSLRSLRMSGGIRSESISNDASASASASAFSPPSSALSHLRKVSFCQWCGAATKQAIPDGDDKIRSICTVCEKVAYQNPKMVVGCLIEHDNKVLLCKRNISPSYGLWTLPAGYLEIGESALDGAIRETQEEARAEVEVLSPFAQLDIPLIGQTYVMFRAKLKSPHFSPGPESIECQLFALDDIPFDNLAFSSMFVTLNLYIEDLKAGNLKFHYCTINKRPGSNSSDIRDFTLDNHLHC